MVCLFTFVFAFRTTRVFFKRNQRIQGLSRESRRLRSKTIIFFFFRREGRLDFGYGFLFIPNTILAGEGETAVLIKPLFRRSARIWTDKNGVRFEYEILYVAFNDNATFRVRRRSRASGRTEIKNHVILRRPRDTDVNADETRDAAKASENYDEKLRKKTIRRKSTR